MTTKLLNNGAFLLFAMIMAGLLFNAIASKNYSLSNSRVLEAALEEDFLISYAELEHWLQKEADQVVFIDLRDSDSFARSHIPGALNIPAQDILAREHRKLMEQDEIKLLYAGEEHIAVTAAMILHGKAVENMRVVPGDFSSLEALLLGNDALDPAYRYYRDDKARFDYPRFMKTSPVQTGEENPTTTIPEIKTEVISVQGGC